MAESIIPAYTNAPIRLLSLGGIHLARRACVHGTIGPWPERYVSVPIKGTKVRKPRALWSQTFSAVLFGVITQNNYVHIHYSKYSNLSYNGYFKTWKWMQEKFIVNLFLQNSYLNFVKLIFFSKLKYNLFFFKVKKLFILTKFQKSDG